MSQAISKCASGQYINRGSNGFGDEITINITVPGTGSAAGTSATFSTGWLHTAGTGGGDLSLSAPFSGYVK